VSGPKTREVVEQVFAPAGFNPAARQTDARNEQDDAHNEPPGSSRRFLSPGSLRLSGVHSPLPADLYFFPGPHSYTGQDLAELHTIGSPPLVERLVADLLAAGARPARPGEFTLRAFLAGQKDLPQAEAVQAVVEAGT